MSTGTHFARKRLNNPLDNDRRRHTPAAHIVTRAALEIAPLQFVENGADQDRTGRSDGMAECDRTTLTLTLSRSKLEISDEFFGDDGKGPLISTDRYRRGRGPALASTCAPPAPAHSHQGRGSPMFGHGTNNPGARLQAVAWRIFGDASKWRPSRRRRRRNCRHGARS